MSEQDESEQRPAWPFDLREDDARWLLKHHINQIEHHWKFTSVDTSEEWLEFVCRAAQGQPEARRRFEIHIFDTRGIHWRPSHAGLIDVAKDIRDRIQAIDNFEAKHKRERAQYERLRAKFET